MIRTFSCPSINNSHSLQTEYSKKCLLNNKLQLQQKCINLMTVQKKSAGLNDVWISLFLVFFLRN